ncbi:hypothetical protein L873DRAFT_1416854 [Choiromyces venosus 120613-1]|uniref:Uncharacterized protein n=1 Tax=Choiromyces venosus 120613-1 TaxID=1336337 RepID=A0A3N4J8L6_9PEZI|nr:hypothetical protein L873DRAFT_1416854 [Choiromyces venosus 120613-1]
MNETLADIDIATSLYDHIIFHTSLLLEYILEMYPTMYNNSGKEREKYLLKNASRLLE